MAVDKRDNFLPINLQMWLIKVKEGFINSLSTV